MANGLSPGQLYEFGPFCLDPHQLVLYHGKEAIYLPRKDLETLVVLVENHGRLIEKDKLLEKVWPGTFVEEGNLAKHVSNLRQVLGEAANGVNYIETVPRRGYRFTAHVSVGEPAAESPAAVLNVSPHFPEKPRPRTARRLRYSLASAALVALILAAWLGARFTKRPSVNSAEAGKKASVLAVLPFENLTGDPSQEYISDGLTEETISYLSRLNAQRLGVIARTSAMAYKGSTKRVDQIARELKADYVLEGSIRRSGERLRVTAQLIRAADQNHLWAYSYDVAMSDILTVQVQAAEAISNEVQIYLTPLEKQRLAGLHVASAEVYKTYLKGLYFLHQRSFASLTQAQASFEEAVSKDPQYAPAYAGLADTLNLQAFYAVSETPDVKQRAAEAAMTALRLDESLPQGHAALGYAKFMWFWDWAGAEREFQRALQLNPTYAPAHHWYALFLSAMARHKEAIEQVQRAQQIDPFSPAVQAGAGYVYYLARDFDQAVEQCRLALEMNPALAPAYAVAGWSYDQKGMYDDAIRNLEKAETLSGQMPLYSATRARVLARAGRKREAQTILRRLEAALAAEDSSKLARTSRHDVALVASALGDHRRALQLMNQAYSRNLGYFVWLKVDPMYDELRDEPGFTELARRVGLPD